MLFVTGKRSVSFESAHRFLELRDLGLERGVSLLQRGALFFPRGAFGHQAIVLLQTRVRNAPMQNSEAVWGTLIPA
jgi:hypothetical protein